MTYPNTTSNEALELILPALVSNFLQRGVQKLAVKLVQRVFLYFRNLLHNSSYLQVPGTLRSKDINPLNGVGFCLNHFPHAALAIRQLLKFRVRPGCEGGSLAVLPDSPVPRRSGKPDAPVKPCSLHAARASASPSARC